MEWWILLGVCALLGCGGDAFSSLAEVPDGGMPAETGSPRDGGRPPMGDAASSETATDGGPIDAGTADGAASEAGSFFANCSFGAWCDPLPDAGMNNFNNPGGCYAAVECAPGLFCCGGRRNTEGVLEEPGVCSIPCNATSECASIPEAGMCILGTGVTLGYCDPAQENTVFCPNDPYNDW